METFLRVLPIISLVLLCFSAVGTVYAIRVASRKIEDDDAVRLAHTILSVPTVESKVKEWATTVLIDKLQTLLSRDEFMPRDLQDAQNDRVNERLVTLEQKVDKLVTTTNGVTNQLQNGFKEVLLEIQRKRLQSREGD